MSFFNSFIDKTDKFLGKSFNYAAEHPKKIIGLTLGLLGLTGYSCYRLGKPSEKTINKLSKEEIKHAETLHSQNLTDLKKVHDANIAKLQTLHDEDIVKLKTLYDQDLAQTKIDTALQFFTYGFIYGQGFAFAKNNQYISNDTKFDLKKLVSASLKSPKVITESLAYFESPEKLKTEETNIKRFFNEYKVIKE